MFEPIKLFLLPAAAPSGPDSWMWSLLPLCKCKWDQKDLNLTIFFSWNAAIPSGQAFLSSILSSSVHAGARCIAPDILTWLSPSVAIQLHQVGKVMGETLYVTSRLDTCTSGVVLLARSVASASMLNKCIRERRQREYVHPTASMSNEGTHEYRQCKYACPIASVLKRCICER